MSTSKIKKGDMVKVIAGGEINKEGKVLSVDKKNGKVIVEGVNKAICHEKPSAKNPQGGFTKIEAPIHISNLSLIDPKSGKPTRIAIKVNEDGKKVRIAKKSGQEIK